MVKQTPTERARREAEMIRMIISDDQNRIFLKIVRKKMQKQRVSITADIILT